MALKKYCILILFALACYGCIDPFSPPNGSERGGTLVVEAFIDPKEGFGKVTLTRSVPLSLNEPARLESRASVTVEDDIGTQFVLQEKEPGIYSASAMGLSFNRKYKLHIVTLENKSYQSDYIEVKQTPPIDSISYSFVGDGVEIRVNTHDPTGNTRYYRWMYAETWVYYSHYRSLFRFISPGVVIERTREEAIQQCWKTMPSTSIALESTIRLEKDQVSNFPLILVPPESIKLWDKYSALVRQQALTKQAFDYWASLQKTTESLGGLFDPLPTEIKGNISCLSDPGEMVIGFFSGGSIEEKRIFITPRDLPDEATQFREAPCQIDTIWVRDLPRTPTTTLLVGGIYNEEFEIIGYTSSDLKCIDCRLLGGGVLTKPEFWD